MKEESRKNTSNAMGSPTASQFWLLVSLAFVGVATGIPYEAQQNRQPDSQGTAVMVVYQVVLFTFALGMSWLGIRCSADRIDNPILEGWGSRNSRLSSGLIRALILASACGLGIAVLLELTDRWLMSSNPEIRVVSFEMPLWINFFRAIRAGILEEMTFRLGFMTWFFYLIEKWLKSSSRHSHIWVANILASVLFGLIHLPQMIVQMDITSAAGLVTFVFFANFLLALLLGYLYARFGLLSAIVAHFFVGFYLRVLSPILFGV